MKVIYTPKGKALEYAPLAANLFRGCSHGCDYCYAPAILRMDKGEFYRDAAPRKDVLKHLEKQLQSGEFKGKRVLLSFTTDPYHNKVALDLTLKAMGLFVEYGVNWNVLTKSMNASGHFPLYRKNDKFGMSLTFYDAGDSLKHEPNASLPQERFNTLMTAHSWGIKTWASLEPVIDPGQTLKIIEATHEFVDFYKVGKINYQKTSIDWVKFRGEAIKMLEKHGKEYYVKKDLREILY